MLVDRFRSLFFTIWENVWFMLHLQMHVVSMLNSQHVQWWSLCGAAFTVKRPQCCNQITCLYKYKTDLIIKLNHISLSGIVIELIIIKTISQLASNTFIHMPILIVTLICCLASVHFRLCVYHFLIKLFFNNSLWLGIGKTCPFYTLDVRVKLAFIWCFKKRRYIIFLFK